jgi:hypothetical protein
LRLAWRGAASGRNRSRSRAISPDSAAPLASIGAGLIAAVTAGGRPGVIAADNHAARATPPTKMIAVRLVFIAIRYRDLRGS